MNAYVKTYDQTTDTVGIDKYGNEVSNTSSLLAVTHKVEGVTCLDCHQATLEQRINEAMTWVSGDYPNQLKERQLKDLAEDQSITGGNTNWAEICANGPQYIFEELGKKMGVDVEKFVKTMETYQADCDAGTGDSVFGKKAEWMIKLEPPYSAYPVYAGLCQSNGGIRVDVNCRVCDRYFVPIKGLYAGGLTISGFNTMVYVGGTAQGVGLWSGLKGGRDIVETCLGGKVDEHWYGEKPYEGPFVNMKATDGNKPHPAIFGALTYSWD